jgi:EAL and modified HD-GYP domain-containing signal transduction protein
VLGGVLAFEGGDFAACARRVSLIDIARAYRDALDWTSDAALQLA